MQTLVRSRAAWLPKVMLPAPVDALGRRNSNKRRQENNKALINEAALGIAEDLQIRDASGWLALNFSGWIHDLVGFSCTWLAIPVLWRGPCGAPFSDCFSAAQRPHEGLMSLTHIIRRDR